MFSKDITGTIFNIQRYSLHDGAGIRTTVFFKGCPLKCIWCSNPESQICFPEMWMNLDDCIGCSSCTNICENDALTAEGWDSEKCQLCRKCEAICPTGARSFKGRELKVSEVITEVMKDYPFYQTSDGGVTLSGGEPLMQIEFAEELVKALKSKFLHVAIETCGLATWDKVKNILEKVDQILFDIKHMDPEIHKKITGHDNHQILDNAARAALFNNQMIIRVPIIGGINSDEGNISKIAQFAKKIGVKEVHLLPYHTFGESKYKKMDIEYKCNAYIPKENHMNNLKNIFESYDRLIKIGG